MSEPLSLSEVKLNLRLEEDDTREDARLLGLITAAREHVENDCDGLILVAREIVEPAVLDAYVNLTTWPIAEPSDIEINYDDADGIPVTVSVGAWRAWFTGLDLSRRRPIRLQPLLPRWGVDAGTWAGQVPVRAVIQAGYSSPNDVPAAIKQAMHLLIAHWYNNREAAGAAMTELPIGVNALLRRFKVWAI